MVGLELAGGGEISLVKLNTIFRQINITFVIFYHIIYIYSVLIYYISYCEVFFHET